ncbi:protein CUSTOS [Dicentrarchus labrax]|uniref:protein CUSTOS n=1 Tax=Dicentrarchus labrax TaxID=13489 RepID=UPI0021F526B3|nr:protein CUSTOS [Dicentrarchus labrax]
MAAGSAEMVGVRESSSSSDEEALRRCQEAVWENKRDTKKDGDTSVQQSKRVVVADHEHDGNELQVTAGFRTHVAKKLGNLLDSFITETETSSCVESTKRDDDDDEGFRLFSTSVPGQTAAEDLPAPPRRRPVPSSSDSDSEMETRLKEAAVSIKDLLPSLSSTLPTPAAGLPRSEITKKKKKKKKKPAEEEESGVAKKKEKRKPDEEDSVGSPPKAQNDGERSSSEQQHLRVKVKKKKRREGNSEEETLN